MESQEKPTFEESIARINRAFDGMEAAIRQFFGGRPAPVVCQRCEYDPCVCGDPDFELEISAALAEAEDRQS